MHLIRIVFLNLLLVVLAGLIQTNYSGFAVTYNDTQINKSLSAYRSLQQRNPLIRYFSQNISNNQNDPLERFYAESELFRFQKDFLIQEHARANGLPILRNPQSMNVLTTYDSCTSLNGDMGICLPGASCLISGGSASGSCSFRTVCCLNVVSTCSATVTRNNTYWQTPATGISSSSTCSLTIHLSKTLPELIKPICQIRLDFVSFSIAQPTAGSCVTDQFKVSGSDNIPPTICGDNQDQHMYLNVPSSKDKTSDVQLFFAFGSGSVPSRLWKIKIAMLPCGAPYLAPPDCLQYHTGEVGTIRSFNWADSVAATRQLANQEYNICFRTETINGKRSNSICFQTCAVLIAGSAFLLTGAVAGFCLFDANCPDDYIVIANGADSSGNRADRYCGGTFSAGPLFNTQVCTTARPYHLYYRTNGIEPGGDVTNTGFCFNYVQTIQ